MPEIDKEEPITYMWLFFVDIVGLSDPIISTNTQVNEIRALNKLISEYPTFVNTNSHFQFHCGWIGGA